MTNTSRITLASFLAYFVMSGMLAPIGIVTGPMAAEFKLPITVVTAQFSWLTVGIFVGAVIALVIFRWWSVRQVMVCVYASIALSLLSLGFDSSLSLVGLRLGLVGVACGLGLPAAAFVISATFDDAKRASMLVITDGFFSIAGIVCSWLAIYFVAHELPWFGTYLFVAGVATVVLLLVSCSQLPKHQATVVQTQVANWPKSVWLCIAILGLYTLGQNSILLWLPHYAQQVLGYSAAGAGNLVGQFWTGMFAAQLFVAWWVLRIGVRWLAVIAGLATLVFSLPLLGVSELSVLTIAAAAWGFANLGFLKVIVSFATELVAVISPTLVSSLLLGATVGTAVSPWLSSQVVASVGPKGALLLGSGCYLLMCLLLALAMVLSRVKLH